MKLTPLVLCLAAALPAAASDYHILTRFHVGGGTSRYDYLRADPANHHLFLANWEKFVVLDLDSGAKVGEIGPTVRAHGVALAPKYGHGFASSGNTNSVLMFDLKSLKVLATIPSTGKNPDGIEYDRATDRVYTANGASGSVTVIDPDSGKVVGTITIPGGKLEAMGFESPNLAFVNDEENSCVHVFDPQGMKATVNWPSAPGQGGTGLAVDRKHHRVFSACGNGKLVVFDTESGKVVATAAVGDDPDAAVFDPKSQRIFVSNADSTLTVIHEDSPDAYTVEQTVPTGPGAKTCAFAGGKLYLATAQFQKDGSERPPLVAGTLEVLVVGE